MGDDEVTSYTGFRTISKGTVDGVTRPLLNGEFIFMFGTLDQGYWPDGIYTPPSREAMVYDLEMLKNLGFNMLRKHVSEPASRLMTNLANLRRVDQSRDRPLLPSVRSDGPPAHPGHACTPPAAEQNVSKWDKCDVSPRCGAASGVHAPA